MDTIYSLVQGFTHVFIPVNLLYCFIGVLLGTCVGVMPGLGNSTTIALLLPITYYFNDAGAIMLLAGIYYGCQYGGSTTAILLNIPGEAVSIVTCFDGYEMHKKGRGGAALGISAIGSFVAGTLGTIGITFLAPVLVEWALKFGPPEYFALVVMGLTLVSYLSQGSMLKGFMMAVLGMLLATVGLDPMRGAARYDFGTAYLLGGIELTIIAMGMFALSEVFNLTANPPAPEDIITPPKKLRELLPNRQESKDSVMPILRGSLIGFLIGILPGGGAILATFTSYAIEKKQSKHPELFGTGVIQGVAGPESANNGSSSGAFIPMMTMGIPSNVSVALLLGALMIHGIQPGPMFMKTRPDVFWGLIASMYVGNIMLLILNLPLIGIFTKIARVPLSIIIPVITSICLVGAFTVNNSPYNVYPLILLGIFAFIGKQYGFSAGPFCLGFVLEPLFETSLQRSLMIFGGDFGIFFSRPISATLLTITLLVWFFPVLSMLWRKLRKAAA